MTRSDPWPTTLAPGGRRADWQPGPEVSWVLLDIDGTLMGPTGQVTPAVVDAVTDTVAAGISVGYATGRNVAGITEVHAQLGLAGPHVVLNGAQVRHGGSALHTWALGHDQLDALLATCARDGLYAELYTEDGFLVTAMDHRFQPHWDEVIGWPSGTVATHPPAEGEVIKATIVTLPGEDAGAVVSMVRSMGLAAGAATSPVTPGFTYVNITRADVDKGAAIGTACQALGIGVDEVVVVGDGGNDLPMLAVAGTAIAMGGSPSEVQAAAHLMTGSVEDDGAAQALREVMRWHTRLRSAASG